MRRAMRWTLAGLLASLVLAAVSTDANACCKRRRAYHCGGGGGWGNHGGGWGWGGWGWGRPRLAGWGGGYFNAPGPFSYGSFYNAPGAFSYGSFYNAPSAYPYAAPVAYPGGMNMAPAPYGAAAEFNNPSPAPASPSSYPTVPIPAINPPPLP